MATVTVLYFAKIRTLLGKSREQFEVAETVEKLMEKVAASHPSLTSVLATCAFAVNEEYVQRSQTLKAGDVVAIIPPVSGG